VRDGRAGDVEAFDDQPVRRTGARPRLAAGNSNGDVPMLEFTHHADKPTLLLVVLHDDAEREFDYTTGAEQAARTSQGRRRDGGQRQERLDHRFLICCGQRRTSRLRND
jgi:hypothetical protein